MQARLEVLAVWSRTREHLRLELFPAGRAQADCCLHVLHCVGHVVLATWHFRGEAYRDANRYVSPFCNRTAAGPEDPAKVSMGVPLS